jgi:hypothetical protein
MREFFLGGFVFFTPTTKSFREQGWVGESGVELADSKKRRAPVSRGAFEFLTAGWF